MIDLEAMNAEIRAHARAEVPELRHDDLADNLPEKISAVATTPAIFVMIERTSAAELSPGIKSQRVELTIIVGVITQSLASVSGASKGALGSNAISAKVIKALHWWKPAAALEKLKFRGEEASLREGSRLGTQLRFTASIHETYN